MTKDIDIILDFWFGEAGPAKWWKKDAEFDYEIKARFQHLMDDAAAGKLDGWAIDSRGALALILLLDQFPRNVYRGLPKAFATDAKAKNLTLLALKQDYTKGLGLDQCVFMFLPLEHSENLEDQELCVELMRALGNENYLKFALAHKAVIEQFGRFPHRNAILGRPNTPEEDAYLSEPGAGF